MPINMSIAIRGSVGQNGRNDGADVSAVQNQLNGLMNPPRAQLVVDGRCGRKTVGAILDFQASVVGLLRPDGRVDPKGRTLAALNDPSSEGKWARMSMAPVPPPDAGPPLNLNAIEQQRLEALKQAAANSPEGSVLTAFLAYLAANEVATLKMLLNVQGAVQYPVDLIRTLSNMRTAGFTLREVGMIISDANRFGKGSLDNALEAMQLIGKTTRTAQVLKSIGNIAAVLQVAATVVVAADHFKAGRYGPGFAEIYGTAMGMAIPWAGFLNAVQELLFAANPNFASSPKTQAAFRLLLACEPIGAGKTAIDTAVTFVEIVVTSIFGGKVPPNAVDQLVDRMRNSPMRFWTDIGDSMGDWMGDKFGDWYYRNFLR